MSQSRLRKGKEHNPDQAPMEQVEGLVSHDPSNTARAYGMGAERESMGMDGESVGGGVPYGDELAWLFGLDLSDVSVRLGQTGDMDTLDATASAEDRTLSFASANPSKREVAHEVAHLAQFERGAPTQGAELSAPEEAPEREAEQAAHTVMLGRRPQVSLRPSARRMRSKKRKTNASDRLTKQKLNSEDEPSARAKQGGVNDAFALKSGLTELTLFDSRGGEIVRLPTAKILSRIGSDASIQLNRHRLRSFPKNDGTAEQVTRVYAFAVRMPKDWDESEEDESEEDESEEDRRSGWIDIDALVDEASVASDVGANKEGKKVTAVRSSDPFTITGAGSEVLAKYRFDKVTKNPNNGDVNRKALDYLGGEHDLVNMTIGLPGNQGGISTHSFAGNGQTEFHQVNDLYYDVPLYKWIGAGERRIQSRQLRFVYGWAKLESEKVWGWIARPAIRPKTESA